MFVVGLLRSIFPEVPNNRLLRLYCDKIVAVYEIILCMRANEITRYY